MATVDKNKFTDLKKFIKEEPGSIQRLQSIKLPRDLNLGLPKQTKKVFVPNLNAVRNRDKPKEFNNRNDKNVKKFKDRKNTKNNRDASSRFVQSSGVFSEGIGEDAVRSRSWGGRNGDSTNSNSAPAISMPTIKKNSFQVDKKVEDSVLTKITDCDDESDDEKLPFQPISWQNKLQKPTLLEIKKEIDDKDGVTPSLKKLKLDPDLDNNNSSLALINEYYKEDNFNNDQPSISLWGLPDSFAGKGLSDDPNCKKLFDYCLGDMLEGQIGKIVLRKSGRMEVHIGNMSYELEPEATEAYKEDIISLETQENERINAAILGNIKNRYFLSPNWDKLLL
ncbi:unnamed protein product [Phyllotreta striolata]|uniref:DNA-directed RNA polymerase III subunit RPC4 n=1 Tax=Phyllotreta striolata TaxID=444603 RepID=A0A9N9THH1_PHYSR|nr:unnamed protein product [Phyllotreta striolata]